MSRTVARARREPRRKMKKSHLTCFENSTWNGMVYGPTGNRVAWLPLYNLNCKARNTPVDKTGVNFSCCSQGVLRTVDAPSLLFRLNRALELIRCCEKELCEIQTCVIEVVKVTWKYIQTWHVKKCQSKTKRANECASRQETVFLSTCWPLVSEHLTFHLIRFRSGIPT